MSENPIREEAEILDLVHHLLAAVIKDTAPPEGEPCVITPQTSEQMQLCLDFIASRKQHPEEDWSLDQKRQAMVLVRKVLSAIVRDTTPPQPGVQHILADSTIAGIRQAFGAISERERRLAEEAGVTNRMRPRYKDEPSTSKVVPITSLLKSRGKS